MKKIILFLCFLISILSAQTQKKVRWVDLQEAVKDSIRISAGGIEDSLDALTGINGISYIGRDFGQKIVKNIATLQAYQPDSVGTTVYLREITTGGIGGGTMVYCDSTDFKAYALLAVPDSIIIFHAPGVDRIWVREEVLQNPYYRSGKWGSIENLYNSLPSVGGVIHLPGGRYDIGEGIQLTKTKRVSIVTDERWTRFRGSPSFDDYPDSNSAIIYSSSQDAQFFFDFDDNIFSNGTGFVFENLVFEIDYPELEYVINGRCVNFLKVNNCIFWANEDADRDSAYAVRTYVTAPEGNDASWSRVTDNIAFGIKLFKSGDEAAPSNQNQHYIARNVVFGIGEDSTNQAPGIKIIGNHRSIIEYNNLENLHRGIIVDGGWHVQTRGNSGEAVRKFLTIQNETKGSYFNDIGISAPVAADGDTLYIVNSGDNIGNTFIAPGVGSEANGIYNEKNFIKIHPSDIGRGTLIGSGVYQVNRITMPDLTNLDPNLSYVDFAAINYKDQLEGKIPDSLEYWNGSAWADWSGSEDFVEATLNTADYVSVDSTHKKIRVWYPITGKPAFLKLDYGAGNGTHSTGVKVEYLNSGGTAVSTTIDTSLVSSSGGGFLLQCGLLSDATTQVRITLNFAALTGAQTIRIARLALYSWNTNRSGDTRSKIIMGTGTPVSFASGTYGDIYIDKTNGSSMPLWVSDGSASKTAWRPVQTIDMAASLPSPVAALRGQMFLKTIGAGVKDSVFVCVKNAADAYIWEYQE